MTLRGSGRGRCHDRVDNAATSQENLARIETWGGREDNNQYADKQKQYRYILGK